jgi:FKBP-type peptidyl-prolyl cis-trans isomerase FkpA
MKKLLLITTISLGILYISSCGKTNDNNPVGCTDNPVQKDSTALLNFATANSITPTKDVSGLYYQIITPGTGATATGTSLVEVTYQGTLLNGTVFDATATGKTVSFTLNQLIIGWQIAIPKIKAGGRIKMLIPSAYAYGCAGAGTTIPANAPLYFDMTLVSVK